VSESSRREDKKDTGGTGEQPQLHRDAGRRLQQELSNLFPIPDEAATQYAGNVPKLSAQVDEQVLRKLSVSDLIGACPVITTATDSAGLTAVDELARQKGFLLANPGAVRTLNGALLEGRLIRACDPENRLGWSEGAPHGYRARFVSRPEELPLGQPGLSVSWRAEEPQDEACHLLLRPRCLVVGLGCHPGAPVSEILGLIASVFAEHGLSQASIACLTSTTRRQNEPGLAQAARALQVPFICVEHDTLCSVQVPNPSPHVKKHLGVDGICEASAMIQAGQGKLLVTKTKGRNTTLAVALAK